jgi:hypothetical protein
MGLPCSVAHVAKPRAPPLPSLPHARAIAIQLCAQLVDRCRLVVHMLPVPARRAGAREVGEWGGWVSRPWKAATVWLGGSRTWGLESALRVGLGVRWSGAGSSGGELRLEAGSWGDFDGFSGSDWDF